MTDLLAEQASIKSRHRVVRDPSGRFIQPAKAVLAKLVKERTTAQLRRDVDALHHSENHAWVHGHFRPLPGKQLCPEADAGFVGVEVEPDLLNRVAA